MTNSNSQRPISGVKCVVTACVHHTENDECLAGSIKVGGHNATDACQTDCETFDKRECCN
ncbi:MAG: DUF1540 domain-containing protein [Clostridia bacterium]|nr:DUF1540 domain-containing protein [Clostridia bacterium]